MTIKDKVTQSSKIGNNPDLLPDAVYWPFERLPESKLQTYAMACVETALEYSEDARTIYTEIIQSWELTGCQVLINEFGQYKQDTRAWLRDRAKAVVRNQPPPDWPDSWKDVIARTEGNTDFHKLLKYVAYFILIAFNRKADIENQTPKILPRKSSYLAQAIVFCSLLDYLEIKPELKGPRVMPDSELTEFHWFCRTLANRATTRPSRQIRRNLRRQGFDLHHYSKLLDDAEKWYKCRVDPGSIEDYLNELATQGIVLDRGRIENDIAPCDEATGYPRQWRK